MFMVSTFVAPAIYGLALLKSPQLPGGLGWFALGYCLFGAAASA